MATSPLKPLFKLPADPNRALQRNTVRNEAALVATVLAQRGLADHPDFEAIPEAAFQDHELRLVLAAIRQVKEEIGAWTPGDVEVHLEERLGHKMDLWTLGGLAYPSTSHLPDSTFVSECKALRSTVEATTLALPPEQATAALAALEDVAALLANDDCSDNTRRSYENDLADFFWWIERHHLQDHAVLTAYVVAMYLADCSTERWFLTRRGKEPRMVRRQLKFSTLKRRLASLRYLAGHLQDRPVAGFEASEDIGPGNRHLARLMKGAKRQLGLRTEGKAAFSLVQIQRMVQWIRQRRNAPYAEERQDALNIRDEALLLAAFGTGRRRSVLAALQAGHLTFDDDAAGVEIEIVRSKGDQFGKGSKIYLTRVDSDFCPVAALRRHLGNRRLGPVFQRLDHRAQKSRWTGDTDGITGRTVANVIQAAAAGIGLDPRRYGAHSMRHSMVRKATAAGIELARIQATGGWGSVAAMDPYLKAGEIRKASFTAALFS